MMILTMRGHSHSEFIPSDYGGVDNSVIKLTCKICVQQIIIEAKHRGLRGSILDSLLKYADTALTMPIKGMWNLVGFMIGQRKSLAIPLLKIYQQHRMRRGRRISLLFKLHFLVKQRKVTTRDYSLLHCISHKRASHFRLSWSNRSPEEEKTG